MSGPGAITVTATGSITAPTTIAATVSAALAAVFSRTGRPDVVSFPSLKAVAVVNGVDFNYHWLDAAQYLTGPLAPSTEATVASTSTRATNVFTFTAATNPLDGETVGFRGVVIGFTIKWKTTLSGAPPAVWEVKIGASLAASIANLQAMFNGSGVDGVNYQSPTLFGFKYPADYWYVTNRVECSATTGTTLTARARDYGTTANGWVTTMGGAYTWSAAGWSGGASSSTSQPPEGTYSVLYVYVRKADGATTGGSPIASVTQDGAGNLTYSNLTAPNTRDGIDIYRSYRTLSDASEFLPAVEGTASPLTDDLSDARLDADGALSYDPDIVRPYTAGYPVRARCQTEHLGSMFTAGLYPHAKHADGTASVTKYDGTNAAAARAVTLSAGTPTTKWIGRLFRATADETRYRIVEVVEATKVITLSTPYLGATNGTAAYEVVDARKPFSVYYCVPGLLNNSPIENEITGITSSDATGVVAMRSAWGSLVAWTRTGAWRIFGNPNDGLPRVMPQAEGCGAWCNRAVVEIGAAGENDGPMVWLGPGGVRSWGGAGDPVNESKPRGEEPTGIESTIQRINARAADGIVGNYNPTLNVVRWFVPVDGSLINNFVIVYNLQTRTFTFGACDGVSSAMSVSDSGSFTTLAGDVYNSIWQLDNGYSDGAYGFECVQAITGYAPTTNTITVAGTPFPTTFGGLTGVPVILISADGTRQRCTIGSNTSSTLKLVGPPDTAPSVGTQIVVGGIFWRMLSSKFTLGLAELRKTLSSMTVAFRKTTAGQLWCAVSVDDQDPLCFTLLDGTIDYALLTASKGTKYFKLNRGPGRTVQIELFTLAPGFDLEVIELAATFQIRGEVPR